MPYACNGCGHAFEPAGPTVGLFCHKCRPPVCSTCNDTHQMDLRGAIVACTRCPVPCQRCRMGGTGAFCESTPCACACHQKRAKAPEWLVPLDDGSDPVRIEIRDQVVPPCVFIELRMPTRLLTPMEAAQFAHALQEASRTAAARRKR